MSSESKVFFVLSLKGNTAVKKKGHDPHYTPRERRLHYDVCSLRLQKMPHWAQNPHSNSAKVRPSPSPTPPKVTLFLSTSLWYAHVEEFKQDVKSLA
jgi:hypothetical protein